MQIAKTNRTIDNYDNFKFSKNDLVIALFEMFERWDGTSDQCIIINDDGNLVTIPMREFDEGGDCFVTSVEAYRRSMISFDGCLAAVDLAEGNLVDAWEYTFPELVDV